jgi:hypothetical protein
MEVKVTDRGAFTTGLDSRLQLFMRQERAARKAAAQTATSVSKATVKRVRPLAPPRRNRYHGLRDALEWKPNATYGVELDMAKLNADFPPWLVQEIGSGQRAIQYEATPQGAKNPVGRPKTGATYVKTVRSQVGRQISGHLVWATRGGQYTPPGAATGQQLYLRSTIKGAPIRYDSQAQRYQARMVIGEEIHGQHFIRDGGRVGFRQHRTSVLSAARTQMRKPRR